MTYVMREHPGWDHVNDAWLRAVPSEAGAPVLLEAGPLCTSTPAMTIFKVPEFPADLPPSLAQALTAGGPVGRWANPSLWDAISTAIIRQVIRADQARLQHRRFRHAFGTPVRTPHGVVHALPSPEVVVELNPLDLRQIGLAFKAAPLHAAAKAYIEHRAAWHRLPPHQLVEQLQSVPRIGPWTAGAAVADFTHDWSLYPYGDLAVRTWAKTAAPDAGWPTTEREFANRWRAVTGAQLGPLTLFTLAWGAQHAELQHAASEP